MSEQGSFRRLSIGLLAGWLAVFVLVPNLLVIGTSLTSRHEEDFVSLPITFDNYARLADPLYVGVFARSAGLALLATALCLAFGYPFAYALARSGRRRGLLLLLVIIPFWTNSLVRTYAMRTLLGTQGLVNGLLQALGFIDEPLPLLYSGFAVIVGLLYVLLPFMVLPLYAVMEKLDRRLLEAARDLGAGRIQTLLRVIVPLTLPGIIAGSLMVFLPALGMFYVSDLLGGAKDLLLGNFIRDQFLEARDWPFGSAASVAMTLIMFLLLFLYRKSLARVGKKGLE